MAFTGGDKNGVIFAQLVAGTYTGSDKFLFGKVRAFGDTFDMAGAIAKSETCALARMPDGAVPLFGVLFNSASLSTAVVSVGITGTVAKYRAGAVKTTVVPEMFGVGTVLNVELTAVEEVLLVNDATAAVPTSGTLGLSMFFTTNS